MEVSIIIWIENEAATVRALKQEFRADPASRKRLPKGADPLQALAARGMPFFPHSLQPISFEAILNHNGTVFRNRRRSIFVYHMGATVVLATLFLFPRLVLLGNKSYVLQALKVLGKSTKDLESLWRKQEEEAEKKRRRNQKKS
jgi:hypothetical protein